MTSRSVRFLSFALVAAAAWLALRNAPSTAQDPPAATDVEKRLKALEEKVERLAEGGKVRPAGGTTAQTLADIAERLRAELLTLEGRFHELRAQNSGNKKGHTDRDSMSSNNRWLSRIESSRSECRLKMIEIDETITNYELAIREKKAGVGPDDIQRKLATEQERRDGLQKSLTTLDRQYTFIQSIVREHAKMAGNENAMSAAIDQVRRAYLAVEAARQELDKLVK